MEQLIKQGTASRKRRIAAALVDHLIISFFGVLAIFMVNGFEFVIPEEGAEVFPVISVLAIIPVMILYFIRDFYRGISPGKAIFGIRVVNEADGIQVPSKTNLIARNLTIIIWPVELLVLIFSKEKRRLGDKLGKTKVIYDPQKADKMYRVGGLGLVIFVVIFCLYATTLTVIRNSEAYESATVIISNNPEIREITGGVEGFGSFPSGKISVENGKGEALLQIHTIGKEKNLDVSIELKKDASDTTWKQVNIAWN